MVKHDRNARRPASRYVGDIYIFVAYFDLFSSITRSMQNRFRSEDKRNFRCILHTEWISVDRQLASLKGCSVNYGYISSSAMADILPYYDIIVLRYYHTFREISFLLIREVTYSITDGHNLIIIWFTRQEKIQHSPLYLGSARKSKNDDIYFCLISKNIGWNFEELSFPSKNLRKLFVVLPECIAKFAICWRCFHISFYETRTVSVNLFRRAVLMLFASNY